METAKNTPVLVHFDEQAYKQDIDRFSRVANILEGIVSKFKQLNIGMVVKEDLNTLFNDPVSLVFDKMTNGQPVSIAGLQVHKHKAIELLIKPSGYEKLIAAIQQAKEDVKDENFSLSLVAESFDLSETGSLVVSVAKCQQLKKRHEKYATSETAKKVHEFAKSIIDKTNEMGLMDWAMSNPNGFNGFLASLFNTDYINQPPTVLMKAIEHYNSNPGVAFVK